jgi:hypothetical protein
MRSLVIEPFLGTERPGLMAASILASFCPQDDAWQQLSSTSENTYHYGNSSFIAACASN